MAGNKQIKSRKTQKLHEEITEVLDSVVGDAKGEHKAFFELSFSAPISLFCFIFIE